MRVIEVCCGAGGMSLGLKRAGLKIVHAVDTWEEALKVYRHNLPMPNSFLRRRHYADSKDLSQLMTVVPRFLDKECDMIAGDPPCQDFSAAGSRNEGQRANVTVAFAMFIVAIRPQWILMENVPQAKSSFAWMNARTILKRAGYGLTEMTLDASRYGVAQARRRFIVVGRLGEADNFLAKSISDAASERPMSVRDLLGDDVGVHPGRDYPPRMRVFFMRPYKGDSGVHSIDDPCPTIFRNAGAKASRNYVDHPDDVAPARQVPPLNPEQLSQLQGFPTNWSWKPLTDMKDRDQMIANAMPAPMAEAIGRIILARANGETMPAIEEKFSQWLSRSKKIIGRTLRNRKAHLNRARRLLKGRMMSEVDAELALLETSEEFRELSASAKSDLRLALRLHWE